MSSFVLVHGASHGAWCWKKIIPLLLQEGHTVVAPDLPGHGQDKTPIASITLKAYTDRVCEVLDDQTERVILVGHSMGGIVVTQVGEYRPEKIKRIVYLSAIVPANGESWFQSIQEIYDSSLIVVADDKSYYSYKDELVEDLFYGDCSEDDISFAKSNIVPQPMGPVAESIQITEEKYGSIPRVYIECLRDKTLIPAFQKKMYTIVPCEQIISMDTSHSPFLSAPEGLARHLLSFA